MKHFSHHINLICLYSFLIFGLCLCKSKTRKEQSIVNQNKVFDKKPVFDTLLNEFAKPIGYVNDYAGLYTSDEVFVMDSLLYAFETKTSIQLVMVTFDSSMAKSSEIDDITKAIGIGWKVGGDISRGSVIGISKVYKRMRIQNGKSIQKILSDSITKEIIDSVFIPEFRNDRYFEGSISGLKSLINIIQISLVEKTKVEF